MAVYIIVQVSVKDADTYACVAAGELTHGDDSRGRIVHPGVSQ